MPPRRSAKWAGVPYEDICLIYPCHKKGGGKYWTVRYILYGPDGQPIVYGCSMDPLNAFFSEAAVFPLRYDDVKGHLTGLRAAPGWTWREWCETVDAACAAPNMDIPMCDRRERLY